jgi:hypothetical protein
MMTNEICRLCKKKIDDLNGNPSVWGIKLPIQGTNGKSAYYHIGCLSNLVERKRSNKMNERIREIESEVHKEYEAAIRLECWNIDFEKNFLFRQIAKLQYEIEQLRGRVIINDK